MQLNTLLRYDQYGATLNDLGFTLHLNFKKPSPHPLKAKAPRQELPQDTYNKDTVDISSHARTAQEENNERHPLTVFTDPFLKQTQRDYAYGRNGKRHLINGSTPDDMNEEDKLPAKKIYGEPHGKLSFTINTLA